MHICLKLLLSHHIIILSMEFKCTDNIDPMNDRFENGAPEMAGLDGSRQKTRVA